jgi:hypothetical protein
VYRCGYHRGVLRVPTRVRCAERAEEYAIRFVRVTLLVVAQVSADGLGEAGAKNEAPPRPTEPTKARAPHAAGSTRAAKRGGSGRPVPAPRRSAPLASAHDRTKRPVASGARVAGPQRPRAPMWPLRVRSHPHYPSGVPRVPARVVQHRNETLAHHVPLSVISVTKAHASCCLSSSMRRRLSTKQSGAARC